MIEKEFYTEKMRILVHIVVFIIGLFAWYQYTYHLDLKDTVNGFSPHEWIILSRYIDNTINYPSGVDVYFSSFFMYIYIFFYDVLHIDGLTAEKIVIFFEIFSKIISAYIIVNVIFNDEEPLKKDFIFIVFSLFCISGYAFYSDLSRFGEHYYAGLYYNVADAMRLIAISFFFKRKFLLSTVFLSLSLLTHPLYGLIGSFFIFSCIIFYFKYFTKKEYIYIFLACLIFVITLTLFYFNIFNNSYLLVNEQTPSEMFIKWSLFGNYHWYPIEFGLFGIHHQERFLGFITISILFLYSLYSKDNLNFIDKQVFIGWLSMIFLTIVGVYFSWTKDSVFMIKLSLTRASLLALEISILYIVYRFISNILNYKNHILIASVSFVLLVSPFLIKAPFSYGISILLVSLYLFINRKELNVNMFLIVLLMLIFFSIVLLIYYYNLGYIDIDYYVNYIGDTQFIKLFILFTIILYIIKFIKFKSHIFIYLIVSLFLFFESYSWLNIRTKLDEDTRTFAQSYKEVQLWANKNTKKDSIFMLDPSLGSGWRLYSERASFGTFREWTHNSWLYKGDYNVFKSGMERFKEYDINMENKKYNFDSKLKHLNVLTEDIKYKFYHFDRNWFDKISEKYNLNYIVMIKSEINKELNYQVIFENKLFIIYKIKD